MHLRRLLDEYFLLNSRIRSDRTKSHYLRSVKQFSAHLGHEAAIENLTDDNVIRWQSSILDEGFAATTANQRVKQIRALWEWAARRKLVDQFPTFRDVREPESLPSAWWPHELRSILVACEDAAGWIGPHRASTWLTALHHWLYDTGERTEATLALRRDWCDLRAQIARVPANVRKGGHKAMVYRLSPQTCRWFLRMATVETDSGLVFEHQWKHANSFYKRYRRLIEDAGLVWERGKSGPSKMRRTVFTMIEASGGDATAFARHSSHAVTQLYIDQSITLALRAGDWPPGDGLPDLPKQGLARRTLTRILRRDAI